MSPIAAFLPCTVAICWATIVTWLILRALRQFRAYRELRPDPSCAGEPLPSISVIVPARNEERAIGPCVAALAAQNYPAGALDVIVVDDNSTDGTGAIARAAVAGDQRFLVITSGSLPAGWTGKSRACWRGATSADGEWLCFLDADTVPAAPLLRCAVQTARRERLDFISLEPRQELKTMWERLVIPAGLFALAFAVDHRRTNDPSDAAASANGQFILVRRAAYEAAGGHAAVRQRIAEDSALARAVKGAGFRVALLDGAALIRTRMYRDLASLWEGLAKNCVEMFGGRRITLAVSGLGFLLAWSAPALPAALGVLAAEGHSLLILCGFLIALLASLAILGLHVAGARHLGIPARYGFLFPLGYTLAAAIGVDSVIQQRRGRAKWKGRIYTRAR